MSNINGGGPAFPTDTTAGMTLRDYFAAKALPSVVADYVSGARRSGFDEAWQDGVAMDAYRMADAMLKARQS